VPQDACEECGNHRAGVECYVLGSVDSGEEECTPHESSSDEAPLCGGRTGNRPTFWQ